MPEATPPAADEPAKTPDDLLTPQQLEEMERWLNAPVHPRIVEAQEAFLRELPELVQTHRRQWVAYHGSRRLGFHTSKTELRRQCVRDGIPDDEILVLGVEPSLMKHRDEHRSE